MPSPFPGMDPFLEARWGDTDAILELQKLIVQAYFDGSYQVTDYTQPLKPPFSAAEKRWLKAQLKKRK